MKTHYKYLAAIVPMVGFYLLCCFDGNLFSPDSAHYLYFAKKLWCQGELTDINGQQMVHWPPLFICFIIPQLFLNSYVISVNLGLLIAHQIIWVKIAHYHLDQSKGHFFFYVLLGLNTLVLQSFVYIWSEPLFMMLLALAIWYLHRYYFEQTSKDLVLFGISLSLCLLTRNAGAFLIPGFLVLAILVFQDRERWKTIGVTLLASSGLLAWSLYLFLTAGFTSAVAGMIPEWSVLDNTVLTFSELGYNLIPRITPEWLAASSVILVLGIAVFRSIEPSKANLILPILLSYIFFWMLIPANADDIGRFLAPVMPPFLLIIVQSIGAIFKNPKLKLIFYGISYYLIVFSLLRIIRNTITWSNII